MLVGFSPSDVGFVLGTGFWSHLSRVSIFWGVVVPGFSSIISVGSLVWLVVVGCSAALLLVGGLNLSLG